MRKLEYTRLVNLSRLMDELSAIPGMQPVFDPDMPNPETGQMGANVARFLVSGNTSSITVFVPEDVDEAAVNAVLQSHNGSPEDKKSATLVPSERLARMRSPRVITGSRSASPGKILEDLLNAASEAGFVINQTRS